MQYDLKKDLYMEWLCFKQHVHFSLRDKRYLLIALVQYFYSVISFRQARSLRYTFCTLQLIDDYLDGDRACPYEPLEYINNLKAAMKSSSYDQSDLHKMTETFMKRTFQIPSMGEESRKAFEALINIMMDDRKRVLAKKIYSKRELEYHHHTTFQNSLDIVLMAMESRLRSDSIPEIIDIFSWCSIVRDIKEDLDKSLINIPSEVAAKVDHFDHLSTNKKIHSLPVKNWLNEETEKAKKNFLICDKKMEAIKTIHGAFIFRIYLNSMRKYTKSRFQ
jgi:hypothetical protein